MYVTFNVSELSHQAQSAIFHYTYIRTNLTYIKITIGNKLEKEISFLMF